MSVTSTKVKGIAGIWVWSHQNGFVCYSVNKGKMLMTMPRGESIKKRSLCWKCEHCRVPPLSSADSVFPHLCP